MVSSAFIPIILVVLVFAINLLVQRNLTSRYDYQCGRCGVAFPLTPAVAAVAPHKMGGAKYVKCPNCGNRSWATRVPKT
jgi:DNA-directed RNA polymerase subunit RPC12/RpoP